MSGFSVDQHRQLAAELHHAHDLLMEVVRQCCERHGEDSIEVVKSSKAEQALADLQNGMGERMGADYPRETNLYHYDAPGARCYAWLCEDDGRPA